VSAAAGLLQGLHAMIAWGRGPHWLLNDTDAKAYGLALSNAMRHLPFTATQKYFDFSALAVAVFAYDGPRLARDIELRQPGASQEVRRPSGQVFHFRQPPQSPPVSGGAQPGQSPPPGASPAGAPPGMAAGGAFVAPDMTQDIEA
jgi:hypothetical protein